MTGSILWLAIIAVVFASVNAIDYCNLKSCRNKRSQHTMCLYPSYNPGPACQDWKDRYLTVDEKNRIVNKHNELRQKVASGQETRGKYGPQPPAVSMPNLSWDDELAQIAQKWADQCRPGHDTCRDVSKYQVGQNMAMTMNSGENNSPPEDMVQLWYDEVDLFDYRQVPKLTDITGVGHYTQVIWAKTTKVGCGRIKYRDNDWNVHYLICNYGPAGNWLGQPIYEIRR